MKEVASGPSNNEMSHQFRPLRVFVWANPALMSASVPRPIAPPQTLAS